PVKTAEERPGRSRSVVDLDERAVPQRDDMTAAGDDAAVGRKRCCGFVDMERPRVVASAELQHFVLIADAFPAEMHGPDFQVFEVDGRHRASPGIVQLDTVTVTGAEVVRLPAASRATAVRVYDPFGTVVVFRVTE